MPDRPYLLPDGSPARDAEHYFVTWRALGDGFAAAVGEGDLRLAGFDPGICFRVGVLGTLDVPVWLAQRVVAVAAERAALTARLAEVTDQAKRAGDALDEARREAAEAAPRVRSRLAERDAEVARLREALVAINDLIACGGNIALKPQEKWDAAVRRVRAAVAATERASEGRGA